MDSQKGGQNFLRIKLKIYFKKFINYVYNLIESQEKSFKKCKAIISLMKIKSSIYVYNLRRFTRIQSQIYVYNLIDFREYCYRYRGIKVIDQQE